MAHRSPLTGPTPTNGASYGHPIRKKQLWTFEAMPTGEVIHVQARTSGEAAQLARTKLAKRGIPVSKLHLRMEGGTA